MHLHLTTTRMRLCKVNMCQTVFLFPMLTRHEMSLLKAYTSCQEDKLNEMETHVKIINSQPD